MSSNQSKPLDPRIVRIPLKELTIYDVSESELEAIERGGPESLYLNFGILFLTTAISFTVTLITTKIETDRLYSGFFLITTVSFVAAVVLLSLWVFSLRSKKNIIECIRSRRPQEGEPMPVTAAENPGNGE